MCVCGRGERDGSSPLAVELRRVRHTNPVGEKRTAAQHPMGESQPLLLLFFFFTPTGPRVQPQHLDRVI